MLSASPDQVDICLVIQPMNFTNFFFLQNMYFKVIQTKYLIINKLTRATSDPVTSRAISGTLSSGESYPFIHESFQIKFCTVNPLLLKGNAFLYLAF